MTQSKEQKERIMKSNKQSVRRPCMNQHHMNQQIDDWKVAAMVSMCFVPIGENTSLICP